MNSDRDFALAMHQMKQKQNRRMKLQVVSQSTTPHAAEGSHAASPMAGSVAVATTTTAVTATPDRTKSTSTKKKSTATAKRAIAKAAAVSARPSKKSNSSPVEVRVLTALAELHALGIKSPPKIQVALFSNYTNITSTGFAKVMRDFSQSGWVVYGPNQTVTLTAAGVEASTERCAVTPPTTNAAVHARIQHLLPGKPAQMMQHLADGEAHLRWDVCRSMGYSNITSTGFASAIRQLQSLGILSLSNNQNGEKCLELTDIAFPFGRSKPAGAPPQSKRTASKAAPTAARKSRRQKRVKREESDYEYDNEDSMDEDDEMGDDDSFVPDRTSSAI